MWKTYEVLYRHSDSGMPIDSNLCKWCQTTPCHSSLLRKQYVICFVSSSSCSVYVVNSFFFFSIFKGTNISLEYSMNLIRSLTELSTFLWLAKSCWRWWHPFCLLGENRWAALAEKCHTKCKYSTLLFMCLRLFWLFLLFPSALKEHTPQSWMMTITISLGVFCAW